ncbi:MAG: phosphopantetheine-binding protein [Oscillospiraceae bacterium]|nr:phosphopantetheine-binding protein [Oscillospiraceae bacterium]
MILKSNYAKAIINALKEVTSNDSISKDTDIQKDIYIDSMGWIQFLIKLEKKFKYSFEPGFLSKEKYETVNDLINCIVRVIDSK